MGVGISLATQREQKMETLKTTRHMRFLQAVAITILLIVFGGGFAVLADMLDERHVNNIVSDWSTVSGTIISTERGMIGDWDARDPILTIRFEYVVQGVTYQDSQVLIVDYEYKAEVKYPPGNPITVYYNPSSPDNALINPYADMPFWDSLGILLSSLAIGGCIIGCIYIWVWWVRGK